MTDHDPFSVFDGVDLFKEGASTAPGGPAPSNPKDPFSAFDNMDMFTYGAAPSSSVAGTAVRGALTNAIPAAGMFAGGEAGFGLGAEIGGGIGSFFGGAGAVPGAAIGGFIGAIGGGIAGGWGAARTQDVAIKELPQDLQDKIHAQLEADQQQHPWAAEVGAFVPYIVTMSPFATRALASLPADATAAQKFAAVAKARATSGAIMGGFEVANQAWHGQYDPSQIAISTAFGLVFPEPNKFGERIASFGKIRRATAEAAPPTKNEIDAAGIAGPGATEATFKGEEVRPDVLVDAANERVAQEDILTGKHEDAQPDVHGIARRMQPELFAKADELDAHADALRDHIKSITNPSEDMLSEAEKRIDDLQKQLDDHVESRNGYTGGKEARNLRARLRDAEAELADMHGRRDAYDRGEGVETEESASLRSQLLEITRQRAEMGRDIAAAYRHAAEVGGAETVEAPAAVSDTAEAAPVNVEGAIGDAVTKGTEAAQEAVDETLPAASTAERQATVQEESERAMIAAGADPEAAKAWSKVISAFFTRLHGRVEGLPGTPEDTALAEMRWNPSRRVIREMAQRGARKFAQMMGMMPKALDSDPREVALTVNDILSPKTPALPARSRNVEDIAQDLMTRGAKALKALGVKSGRIEGPDPRTDEILSRAIASEIRAALGRGGKTASDWYTQKVREAMAIASAIHPEIASDPHQKFAFTASLAITSQGETVPSNVRLAEQVYQEFKKTGRFPTEVKAKNGPAMGSNFAKLNNLLDTLGEEGTREFLDRQMTVKDLEKDGYAIGGENKGTLVHGSAILGPKIGQGFFQNLNGNYNPVTMDLWFMRAWGRLTGTLVGKTDISKPRARLEAALAADGQKVPKTIKALEDAASKIVSQHEADFRKYRDEFDAGTRKKSELTLSAERFMYNLRGINEQPSSGSQRTWMRDRVARAKEILADEGINVTPADLQAIWWYPEKELYGKLGGRDSEGINVDYAGALRELAGKRGVTDDQINASIRSLDRRPGPAGAADDAGATQDLRAEREGANGAREGAGRTYAQSEDAAVRDSEGRSLNQSKLGEVTFADGVPALVKLFKNANPSTLVHESGHVFLEIMKKYAAHPGASDELRADWGIIKRQFNIPDEGDIPTRSHEKWARTFERYLRDGIAPSKDLAGVFAQFKQWLVDIYKTLRGLGTPINEELRGVFDRMLAENPERTVITPERETAPTIHDIHVGDAEHIEPSDAEPAARRIADERSHIEQEAPPEVLAKAAEVKPEPQLVEAAAQPEVSTRPLEEMSIEDLEAELKTMGVEPPSFEKEERAFSKFERALKAAADCLGNPGGGAPAMKIEFSRDPNTGRINGASLK